MQESFEVRMKQQYAQFDYELVKSKFYLLDIILSKVCNTELLCEIRRLMGEYFVTICDCYC